MGGVDRKPFAIASSSSPQCGQGIHLQPETCIGILALTLLVLQFGVNNFISDSAPSSVRYCSFGEH